MAKILDKATRALRYRAQGLLASMTHHAMNENSTNFPLTTEIVRAFGHYGMKETSSARDVESWDSPAIRAIIDARIKRAAREIALNYVSTTWSDFEWAWWILRSDGFNIETLAKNSRVLAYVKEYDTLERFTQSEALVL